MNTHYTVMGNPPPDNPSLYEWLWMQFISIYAPLFLYSRIVISTMAIICLGSFLSIPRPPSAAPSRRSTAEEDDKNNNSKHDKSALAMFLRKIHEKIEKIEKTPVLGDLVVVTVAFTILVALCLEWDIFKTFYYIFILITATVCIGNLLKIFIDGCVSLLFPNKWTDGSGNLYHIDANTRCQYLEGPESGNRTLAEKKISPFPSWLSETLSVRMSRYMWTLRHFLANGLTIRLGGWPGGSLMSRFVVDRVKFKFSAILGYILSTIVIFNFHTNRSMELSNVIGAALSCTAVGLISPLSFRLGTFWLTNLLVYDLVTVFYTPYITHLAMEVMKSLPLVLIYDGPYQFEHVLVGLGDIALPGGFIALALRFDLDQFYRRKIQRVPVELVTEVASDTAPGETIRTTRVEYRRVKEPFIDPFDGLADAFWTETDLPGLSFPKPYFTAAMVGYAVGIVCSVLARGIFERAQPALLYIVPCVFSAVWLTAYGRGEEQDFSNFTLDGSLDTEDVVVDVDGDGNVLPQTATANDNDTAIDASVAELAKKDA